MDLSLHCPYEAEVRDGALVALSTNVRLDKRPEHGTRSYYAAPMRRRRRALGLTRSWPGHSASGSRRGR